MILHKKRKRTESFQTGLCLWVPTDTHSNSWPAPFLSCCLPWIIIQPEGWMTMRLCFSYPFLAARGTLSTEAMQFSSLTMVFAHTVVLSLHLDLFIYTYAKRALGALVSQSQREGHFVGGNATRSFRRAAHKTLLYAVPASPGPGRPSWAQCHQNTQIQEQEQPEAKQEHPADCWWQQSGLGMLRCLGCHYTPL